MALGASGWVSAADDALPRSVRWRDSREDPRMREELIEQRREQRERMRLLRQELRREMESAPPGWMLERRGGREDRRQDIQVERGSGLRRMSPEERVRFREDMREAWREHRGLR